MSKFPKPMLATNVENFAALKFPKLGSPKLDGIRATAHDGILRSRSLKDIPNPHIQAKLADVAAKYPGLDGELITGSPSGEGVYDRTRRVVMESGKKTNADDTQWFCFDRQIVEPYHERYSHILTIDSPGVVIVPHLVISDLDELTSFEEACIEKGYEGIMLNDPAAFYKHGRSSENEGILLKVKRFVDAEAVITGCYPEYENTNVATTNELGRTARSAAKNGKFAKDTLGGFTVKSINGTFKDVEHDVAVSPMTHAERKEIWEKHKEEEIVGSVITYKYFPVGSIDKPRHPLFKGFRHAEDMSE
jgi:DNA ligase-1